LQLKVVFPPITYWPSINQDFCPESALTLHYINNGWHT